MLNEYELEDVIDRLVPQAKSAAENAYVPITGNAVGAAVLTENGMIFRGASIESAVLPASVCAERAAVINAVSAGETRFEVLAVYSFGSELAYHCGLCLQTLSEFIDSITIITASDERMYSYRLDDLKFIGRER